MACLVAAQPILYPSPMDTVLKFIEIAAVFAAAISGGLEARRRQMDFIGVYFVALATALGGGTMRDSLLGRLPVFWVSDSAIPVYVLAFSLLVVVLYPKSVLARPRVALLIDAFDAAGLGMFSLVGAAYAHQVGAPFFSAVLIGVVNGIVGGVLRDVLCNEIPSVFKVNTQLYATCAFAGSSTYLGLTHFGLAAPRAFAAGLVLTFAMRLLALRFKIGLPI